MSAYRLHWPERWLNFEATLALYDAAAREALADGASDIVAHAVGLRAIAVESQPENRRKLKGKTK